VVGDRRITTRRHESSIAAPRERRALHAVRHDKGSTAAGTGSLRRYAQLFGLPASAKTMIVGAPGLRSTQKFDGLPAATATYCLPPTAYVTMPPPIGPPVVKRYSTVPFFASKIGKSPGSSRAMTTLPSGGVPGATC